MKLVISLLAFLTGIRIDLVGNGKMEIVITVRYCGGEASTIYRFGPKKMEDVLSVGCGA